MKTFIYPLSIVLFIFLLVSCKKEDKPAPMPPIDNLNGWEEISPGLGAMNNLYFLSPAKGFFAGLKGLYRSLDSGKTWKPVYTAHTINDVTFYNQQYGYCVGDSIYGYTTNGGESWNITSNTVGSAVHVSFVEPLVGFMSSITQGVFKTTDGGRNWIKLQDVKTMGIFFKDQQTGWISNENGDILQTKDGGTTFHPVYVNGTNKSDGVYTIYFIDENHGWANNAARAILKTTDGGNNWERTETFLPNYDILFLNKDVGYVPNGSGVAKSVDGGSTWKQVLQVNDNSHVVNELFFIDENTGWAADTEGSLYRWKK